MNMKLTKFKYVAILLAGISATSIPAIARADWSIAKLDTFGNFTSLPTSINDSGQVVGYSFSNISEDHAFITGPDGVGITDLFVSDGISGAFDINNSGQVVGFSRISGNDVQAIITGPGGVGVTDLGTFGESSSSAYAINDSGQVVGTFKAANSEMHTIITGPNGVGFTELGTLGGRDNQGVDINASGQVTGTSRISGNLQAHAYITGADGVGMKDVGALFLNSTASGINDSGQVVGYSDIADGTNHAFVTDPDGVNMTDLGTLGGNFSQSIAINNLGEVVGVALTASDIGWHSFIYSHGGMTDLSLLAPVVAAGWSNLFVADINNNGQIVGSGTLNGERAGFLLSYTPDTLFTPNPIFIPPIPIPEPQTYLMLLAGLSLIGFMARRRKEAGA